MTLASTVDAVIGRIRRDAMMASQGPYYTLDGDVLAGATSLVFTESFTHIGQGATLSIDHELYYVQAVSTGTRTLTVIPGYFNSTPAAHAAGTIVEVDPRFPACMLSDFLQAEILGWGKDLFRVTTLDLPTTATQRSFDLPLAAGEQVYFLLDARSEPSGQQTSFWNFSWTSDAWPRVHATLVRGMSTSEFPSGYAIQLRHPVGRSGTVRLALAQPFDLDPFDPSTDLVADCGLTQNYLEILEWGARVRALHSVAVGRTDWRRGSMARESEEVSVFDVMRAADHAASMRAMRLSQAMIDLRGDWPYREV